MDFIEFMEKLETKTFEYFSLNNVKVFDKDGNEINEIIFKIEESKVIIK